MPKKSDNPSEKVRKASGGLDEIKKALVTTIYTFVKEGSTDTFDKKSKTKPNVVEESTISPISEKKNIYIVNKTEKSKSYH